MLGREWELVNVGWEDRMGVGEGEREMEGMG